MSPLLALWTAEDQDLDATAPVDAETLAGAGAIVEDVRRGGSDALRRHAERLDRLAPSAPLLFERAELERARDALAVADRTLLERVAERIRTFAEAQRASVQDLDVAIEGGRAGHRWLPVDTVGAYAPGGRYPLPSSVLMTVVTARAAGVETVFCASPSPAPITLAAAAVAGADGLLAAGGAQAIAAFAFGVEVPQSDLVVGPGNRWVTAAKKLLVGEVGIDGLAGPSELVVVADGTASPVLVARDLIAQAEHDVDARAMLVTTSPDVVTAVEAELERQLSDLSTADTARTSLTRNGRAFLVRDDEETRRLVDRLAPEHLELCVADPERLAEGLSNYGGLFLGAASAEVFGDYGVGPNHVLPTGGSARFQAGLSVLTFLKPATWMRMERPEVVAEDVERLARHEGLEGHARAARR